MLIIILVLWSTYCIAQAHSVSLTCTDSGSGITGYNFYRGVTSGGESPTPLNSTPSTSCSYVDTNVVGSSTYYYMAEAYCPTCGITLSYPSNEVRAVIPANGTLPQPYPAVMNPPTK